MVMVMNPTKPHAPPFIVRLTADEHAALCALAEQRGVPKRQVIGDAVLDVRTRQSEADRIRDLIDARMTVLREEIAALIVKARDALIEQTRSDLQTVVRALSPPGVANLLRTPIPPAAFSVPSTPTTPRGA